MAAEWAAIELHARFLTLKGNWRGALELLKPSTSTESGIAKQGGDESFHGTLSHDPVMLKAIKIIRNVAETEATVLIWGESGA